MDVEEFRRRAHAAVDYIADYYARIGEHPGTANDGKAGGRARH